VPEVLSFLYERSDEGETEFIKNLRILIERAGANELDQLVQRRHPDAIVCTHSLPLGLIARQKRKGRLKAPVYGVVTDYTAHVWWADEWVDRYFVANAETKALLVERGVLASRIHVTGIPVDPEIAEPKDRDPMRVAHRIERAPVVLLLGGGIRVERVRCMVTELLRRDVSGTLIVVAGRNTELETALRDLRSSPTLKLRVLGFIDYLDDLIAASDLVITKSGGLIVSEVLARYRPMVVIDPIPEHEVWNADYVVSVGAGVQMRLPEMVPVVVENLLAWPERLAVLQAGAEQAGRPHAAFSIVDSVLQDLPTRQGQAP
jgi:processive 1,2-diacylglycerol beta-glucosyltransferase